MKTERASSRRLIGGLIILVALAAGWAVMHRQSQRAERESRSPFYHSMPAFEACGVHLTGDDEHMLGHHGFVGIPFRRLDKLGREILLDLAREQSLARLADRQMSDEQKRQAVEALLKHVPESVVGFQRRAPGSAYVFLSPDQAIPLHVVAETEHRPWGGYNVFGQHGATEHADWERKEIHERLEGGPSPEQGE